MGIQINKKSTLLWLDDVRNPFTSDWLLQYAPQYHYRTPYEEEVVWVKNYKDFCKWITENGLPTVIGFDHDLGTTKTGMDCVKWCSEYCMNNNELFPDYVVQSANPVGKLNMISYIENHKKHCK